MFFNNENEKGQLCDCRVDNYIQLAIWLELLICRFRAYIGNGCGIVSPVLLDEYVITRDKDTESMGYGGSIPPMTQKRKQLSRIFL